MPHKRNPIKAEQVTGLARVLRANSQAALENVALWHERDISPSSVERIIIPDSTTLLAHLQRRAIALVQGMVIATEPDLDDWLKRLRLQLSALLPVRIDAGPDA